MRGSALELPSSSLGRIAEFAEQDEVLAQGVLRNSLLRKCGLSGIGETGVEWETRDQLTLAVFRNSTYSKA